MNAESMLRNGSYRKSLVGSATVTESGFSVNELEDPLTIEEEVEMSRTKEWTVKLWF